MAMTRRMPRPTDFGPKERLGDLDWAEISTSLDDRGCAHIPALLSAAECREVAGWYGEPARFRSTVVMARHGFGQGEYKYFAYPLPSLVSLLREGAYPHLAGVANRWSALLGEGTRYPKTLKAFSGLCHAAGQSRPTPLILRYGAGDYNRLHQDLYGDIFFPLQLAVLLSEPGRDFEGGEFVLAEQRPRMQTQVDVVPLRQGDAVVFAVNERPVKGAKGHYRAKMRHGVSRVRRGHRATLGVIFHDAR